MGSFQMSQFFTSDGQSIGVSVSVSVLPMNIHSMYGLVHWNKRKKKEVNNLFKTQTSKTLLPSSKGGDWSR